MVETAGAIMVRSSSPSRPSSPAWGLSPATAIRGDAMSKSRRSDSSRISQVSTIASVSMAPGTSASGRCTVSGTTFKTSLASIITARLAPVRLWRNSVWPGWGKPASIKTALWTGAVTIAAASPARQALAAISIASITAAALTGSSAPGWTVARVGIRASWTAPKTPASPTSFKGWLPMRPSSAANAASATSGPMPAGSPIVINIGELANLDIGVAFEVAQIASTQRRNLVVEQLVLNLLAGGHGKGGTLFHPRIAAADQFDAGVRHHGRRHFAGLGRGQALLQIRAEIRELHIAHVVKDGAGDLLGQLGELRAALIGGPHLAGDLHRIFGHGLGGGSRQRQQQARQLQSAGRIDGARLHRLDLGAQGLLPRLQGQNVIAADRTHRRRDFAGFHLQQ